MSPLVRCVWQHPGAFTSLGPLFFFFLCFTTLQELSRKENYIGDVLTAAIDLRPVRTVKKEKLSSTLSKSWKFIINLSSSEMKAELFSLKHTGFD